jgi:hypothetical protein
MVTTMRSILARGGAALLLLPLGGCGVFVTRAEPFTPDAPPVSEVEASGRDTAYVVRTPAYVLRTRDRALLWNRAALDDAAWRYRWLFGRTPSTIAVRLDTAGAPGATATDDPASAAVTVLLPASATSAPGRSALALRAARAWLGAGADTTARLPWWFEAGALRIIADGGGGVPRSRGDDPASLTALLAAARPAGDSLVRALVARAADSPDGRVRRTTSRGGGPSVAADAASLLAFLRERDPALVARLPEALRGGRTLPELLGGAKVPATVDALDAEWRRWLRKRPADARAFGAGA